ncbi:MAG: phosphate ABC transporter permease subunit PstC [Bacteroidales bacterium]|nr:phosphate ABC transporter permease subunit PstC [Bacteroidales bacterium]
MNLKVLIKIFRKTRDYLTQGWMIAGLAIVILLPFAIGAGLYIKSHNILVQHSFWDLVGSTDWKPLSGKFGLYPFILSSLWITLIAILIALPIALLSAIHLTTYAKPWVLRWVHPLIDILAGLPSVIYGIWGVIAVVPFVQQIAEFMGYKVSGYSILAAGIVLAIMIIPFILNILIEIFRSIPIELTEVTLSLGATRWQTIKKVILRKALPGIISATGLGISRAFGETIAVLMVAGNVVKIPSGIFQPGYPLPALLINNYGEMLSIPLYDSALMLAAFMLMLIVLFFNVLGRYTIVRFEKRM